jgi:hypothetical protein
MQQLFAERGKLDGTRPTKQVLATYEKYSCCLKR